MSRQNNIIAPMVVVFLLGAAVPALEAGPPSTTDEYLDFSLWSLQQEVLKLSEENRKLAERNRVLRQNIRHAKDEMGILAEKKAALVEAKKEVLDYFSFGSRESSLWRRKLMNTEYTVTMLNKQKRRLLDALRQEQKRWDILRNEVAWVTNQIQEFNIEAKQADPDYRLMILREEKKRMRQEMDDAQDRYDEIEAEIPLLKQDLKAFDREKQIYAEETRVLNQELDRAKQGLEDIKARVQGMRDRSVQLVKEKKERIKALNSEIDQYRSYRDELKDSFAGVREARDLILAEARDHENRLENIKELLNRKIDLLQRRRLGLNDTLAIIQDVRTGLNDKLALQKDIGALNDKIAEMIQQQEKIRARMEEDDRIARELSRQRKEMDQMIRKLAGQSRSARAKAERVQAARVQRKEKELTQGVRQQQQEVQAMQAEIERLTAEVKGLNAQFGPLRERQEERRAQLAEFQAEQENLLAEQARLKKLQQRLAARENIIGDRLETEIEDLKLQRDILLSSLSAVRSRYTREGADFEKEEDELLEYLRILREENKSLQMKVLGLVNRLEHDDQDN